MSTRKTLKDFLNNVKGLSQTSISYSIESNGGEIKEGDDIGVDAQSGKELIDFKDANKGILGDYVNYITTKNNQQINQGNFKSVSAVRGNHPHSNPEDSSTPFVQQGTLESGLMSQYSNSEYFDGDVANLVDKIGGNSKPEPLKGIEGQVSNNSNVIVSNPQGEDNPVVQASQSLLIRNNRFSPTNKLKVFKPNNISGLDFDAGVNEHGTMQVQNDFGKFDNSKFITDIDSLKNIGKSLLLKAGGWDGSDNIVESINPDNFNLNSANSLITEEGVKNISNRGIRAKNAFGFPTDNEGNSARLGRGESSPQLREEKFGAFYNQEINHFDKNYDILRNQAAIALVAIKKSLAIALDQLENMGIKSRKQEGNALEDMFSDTTDSKVKGRYRPDLLHNVDFLKKKLFVKTVHSYYDCVDVGIRILFTSPINSKSEIQDKNASKILQNNSHYWMSIFISVLKRSRSILSSPFSSSSTSFGDNAMLFISKVKNNALLRFMNTIATVGDIHLISNMGKMSNETKTNPRNVDALPAIPATRVMKSRSGAINKTNLSFSGMNLPSAYILPLNVVGASLDMNTIKKGANPSRGMLGSSLANKTYTAIGLQGSYNRIPIEVVREMEDRYESEYLPFYITDLRTNEVIAFHGFLTTLTDAISPSFNESTGYGRLDPIKTYGKTGRTVSFAFKLISTNPQDFDEMWYKINKLVTLFYPQYTDGDTIRKSNAPFDVPMLESATSAIFKQPFSQVIGATPLVRVRIGDVIKSNYSKFNLSRVFGAGDLGTNLRPSVDGNNGFAQILDAASSLTNLSGVGLDIPGVGRLNIRDALLNIFAAKYGSPIGKTSLTSTVGKGLNNAFLKSDFLNTAIDQVSSKIIEDQAAGLINGFVNPIVVNDIINKLVDPSLFADPQESSGRGYAIGDQVFMRATPEKYSIDADGEKFLFNRNILCKVLNRSLGEPIKADFATANNSGISKYNTYTVYELEVIDAHLGSIVGKRFKVVHSDIIPDYSDIYDQTYGKQISKGDQGVSEWLSNSSRENQANDKNLVGKMASNAFNTAINGPEAFMSSFYNPVTRAFETNMGRGLAGTLGGVTFNWLNDDYAWENEFNSRAPMGVDISLTLSVIHDIPPGLDHSGYNRAPLYNVGRIMKEVSGDPNDRQEEAEAHFNSQEGSIQGSIK